MPGDWGPTGLHFAAVETLKIEGAVGANRAPMARVKSNSGLDSRVPAEDGLFRQKYAYLLDLDQFLF